MLASNVLYYSKLFQEPEPCDAQARYETPTKKNSAPDEEPASNSGVAAREPKKEGRGTRPEPAAVKKEPENEEAETEEVIKSETTANPKPKRGRKRKIPAVTSPEPPEMKAEVKEEELCPEPSVSPVKVEAAVPRSPEIKAETTAASSVVPPAAGVKTEIKKVGRSGVNTSYKNSDDTVPGIVYLYV